MRGLCDVTAEQPTTQLPEGSELLRERCKKDPPTLDAIGRRYGVSRQAVDKRLRNWIKNNPEQAAAIRASAAREADASGDQ